MIQTTNTSMKRICPLLERETRTKILHYSPSPWTLRQCLESGFVFLENPPDYGRFRKEFAWEVTSQKQTEARKQAEPVLYAVSTAVKTFRGRLLKRNKILSLAIPLLSKSSEERAGDIHILDMGCGWGSVLQGIMSQLSPDVRARCIPFGVEISDELARIASEKLKHFGGECVNDPAIDGLTKFKSDFFDLIVMSSFLEHEINPSPLLRLCFEHLRPGGNIIVKVPNYGSLNRWIRGVHWCGFRWPDHVNYFTPHTLTVMAQRAGLEVARMKFNDKHPFSDNMYAVLRKPAPTTTTNNRERP